jgi:release factor glutamine methyltransferase
MIVQTFLRDATETLKQAEVPSAHLDCLVLLEDALAIDRAVILAHPETIISPPQLAQLNKHITQRSQHIPLAYIRGKAPFYGREFVVTEHVLVPRPETEIMIEILKTLPLPSKPTIADIGTGSGCVGITASLELPNAKVMLYDIDPEALRVASRNAQQLNANVTCYQADLLEQRPEADVFLANLPYVPEHYSINKAAEYEPKHAIFAGSDGLNLYQLFWEQIATLPHSPTFVLTEALPLQHDQLANIAKSNGYHLTQTNGFVQLYKKST